MFINGPPPSLSMILVHLLILRYLGLVTGIEIYDHMAGIPSTKKTWDTIVSKEFPSPCHTLC